MSMNIKSEEAHRLATELAAVMNTSLTQAVTNALRDALARVQKKEEAEIEEILAIGRSIGSRLKEPWKSGNMDELLYDENGLPK